MLLIPNTPGNFCVDNPFGSLVKLATSSGLVRFFGPNSLCYTEGPELDKPCLGPALGPVECRTRVTPYLRLA